MDWGDFWLQIAMMLAGGIISVWGSIISDGNKKRLAIILGVGLILSSAIWISFKIGQVSRTPEAVTDSFSSDGGESEESQVNQQQVGSGNIQSGRDSITTTIINNPTTTPDPTATPTPTPTPTATPPNIAKDILGTWRFVGFVGEVEDGSLDDEGFSILPIGDVTCGFKLAAFQFDEGEVTSCVDVKHDIPGREIFVLTQCVDGVYSFENEDSLVLESNYESQNLVCEFQGFNGQVTVAVEGNNLQFGEDESYALFERDD